MMFLKNGKHIKVITFISLLSIPFLVVQGGHSVIDPENWDPPFFYLEDGGKPINEFSSDFDQNGLDAFHLEGAKEDSIKLVNDIDGKTAVKFTVRKDDIAYDGNRAEITIDNLDYQGTQGWYSWKVFIPESFINEPKENWQVINQFHDQPKLLEGQGWEDFPPHDGAIALYLLAGPSIGLNVKCGAEKGEFNHGPIKVNKEEWIDIDLHIGWSTGEDGFVEAWINGEPITKSSDKSESIRFHSRTMYYSYPHYFKVGLYRSENIKSTGTIFVSDINFSNVVPEKLTNFIL